MDADILNQHLSWWDENYTIIGNYDILEIVKLGDKNNSCRFCGKSYPEVTFRNVAHAVPELLDNDKLFSFYECDTCNHKFGETIEDHLSKYLFPYRIGSSILGKKGKISYKLDETNRLDVTDGHWNVIESIPESIVEVVDDNTINLKIKRQTYIPIMVYKALVKIALTIVPEDELKNLKNTIDWLMTTDRKIEDFFGQFIMMRFFPGPKPFPYIKIILFKKKSDEIKMPMYQIALNFNNYNFQYIIPCFKKDRDLDGLTINLQSFPTSFDFLQYPHQIGSGLINLSSHDYIKNEIIPIEMHYESKEEK